MTCTQPVAKCCATSIRPGAIARGLSSQRLRIAINELRRARGAHRARPNLEKTYDRKTSSTRSRRSRKASTASALRIHRVEELAVVLGVAQLVEQEVDGVHGAHRVEDAAQDVHFLELIRRHQKLFLAGAGAGDVHGREGALVGDLAVEDQFRIDGALELFEEI